MDKKIVLYRKLNKLCVSCGNPLDRNGVYCRECNSFHNLERRALTNSMHEKGLCISCSKPLDRKGWFCIECNNALKVMQKNKVSKRKAEGICIQCGKKAAVNGKVRCQECLDKNRIAVRRARANKKRRKNT